MLLNVKQYNQELKSENITATYGSIIAWHLWYVRSISLEIDYIHEAFCTSTQWERLYRKPKVLNSSSSTVLYIHSSLLWSWLVCDYVMTSGNLERNAHMASNHNHIRYGHCS